MRDDGEGAGVQATGLRGGMQRLSERWPFLRYLGMGAWWAWIWLCYNSTSLFGYWRDGPFAQAFAEDVGLMYLYSTPAIALMCMLAAAFWRETTPLLSKNELIVLFGFVAALGTLLVAISPLVGGDLGFAIGGVLTGVGTSALCLRTGAVFGTLGRRDVLTAGFVSLLFASFLYFMGTGLPDVWQPLFVAALPLASALFYIMPSDDPFAVEGFEGERIGTSSNVRMFVCLVIAAVVIAATAGFAKGCAAASMTAAAFDQMGAATTFLTFCGALVVCLLVNCADTVKMARLSYTLLILYGVVVAMLSSFGLSIAYMGVGKELLWMLFTCLMAYMVFRFDLSPIRAFGLAQASYLAASALSWCCGMVLADKLSGDMARFAVAGAMVLAIMLVFSFIFTDSDLKFLLAWRHGTAKTPEGGEAGSAGSAAAVSGAEDAAAVRRTPVVESAGLMEGVEGAENAEALEAAGAAGVEGPAGAAGVAGVVEAAASVGIYRPPRELSLHERIQLIDPRFGISAREAEIMELFAGGRSANWIAEELVISKNTVRSHLRSIYTKLDVHTRQELLDFLKTVTAREGKAS